MTTSTTAKKTHARRYNWTVRSAYAEKLFGIEMDLKFKVASGRVTKQRILEAMIELASTHEATRVRIIKQMKSIV